MDVVLDHVQDNLIGWSWWNVSFCVAQYTVDLQNLLLVAVVQPKFYTVLVLNHKMWFIDNFTNQLTLKLSFSLGATGPEFHWVNFG